MRGERVEVYGKECAVWEGVEVCGERVEVCRKECGVW